MLRIAAAFLAACVLFATVFPAARAHALAAAPFPVVPVETPARHGHTRAYLTMAAGAGLVVASFGFAGRADDAYDSYLVATDAVAIERFYDRTTRYDRLSQGSLLCGEALIAVGLYLRFVRRPPGSRLSLSATPSRCSVAYRF
jgi:hypothetical protein